MSFLDKLLGRKNSADNAKERLQLVLIHDRTDLTPAELESLRDDLIATVSRHVEIDTSGMQFGVEHDVRKDWSPISPSNALPVAAPPARRNPDKRLCCVTFHGGISISGCWVLWCLPQPSAPP